MRLASFVLLLALPATACEPNSRIQPADVSWMEWPAVVAAGTPFTARLVGGGVSCVEVLKFVTTPAVDQSAVTFEPYFLIGKPSEVCPLAVARQDRRDALSVVAPHYDVQVAVPGLEAQSPRTYEIRAGTSVVLRTAVASLLPIRTFGEVTVRLDSLASSHINAAGIVFASPDSLGCMTMWYPLGYVIENPPSDTARYFSAFVRGYIYEPAAPVCGKSKVFHLVTRE